MAIPPRTTLPEIGTMKSFVKAVAFAVVLAAPAASFAQSNQPVTRAQLRAELAQLEKAGYNPNDMLNYPENLNAAKAKIAAENAKAQVDTSAYGGRADAPSQAGQRTEIPGS
jgi:hypothetical protein